MSQNRDMGHPQLCLYAFSNCSRAGVWLEIFYEPGCWVTVKVLHGPAFMSWRTGACQLNSGCAARKGAAMKSSPQGCPARAVKLMCSAIDASMTLPETAPLGEYG